MTIQEHQIEIAGVKWFYREALPDRATTRPPVVLLHGMPSQSYGWRHILPTLAESGYRAIAPDWPGFGFSEKPERRRFAYTPDAFVQGLYQFITALEAAPGLVVAQGFVGSTAVQYALRYPDQVLKLAVLNAPVTATAKLPWKMRQWSLPLAGDMLTQDPLLVDRTLEGGGGYRVDDADLDVYRRPFLKSSDAGRALLTVVKSLQLTSATAEIEAGLRQWDKPVLFAWGARDPWLPVEEAKSFAQTLPNAEFVALEEVGHYPQEDWHEKVSLALLKFFA